jgi:hypothetical protein
MWLNYIAMFVCVGASLFQFGMAIKYNRGDFAILGVLCAAIAGLNYYFTIIS